MLKHNMLVCVILLLVVNGKHWQTLANALHVVKRLRKENILRLNSENNCQ
jgi:hypothetical protein